MFKLMFARVQKMFKWSNELSKIAFCSRESGDLIAVCVMEFSGAGSVIQLFPAGDFRALDGRPEDASAWMLDEADSARHHRRHRGASFPAGDRLRAPDALREKKRPARSGGRMVQAAGMAPGEGLFATDVEWTAAPRAMIEAGEYRIHFTRFQI